MRLPEGFRAFKKGLGPKLKRMRRTSDDHGGKSQERFAKIIGIRRETLSRIENGRELPSPNTMAALMQELNFDWGDIAVKGRSSKPARIESPENLGILGQALRIGRKKEKITLEELSERTGISASQLSRMERGQCLRGGHFVIVWPDGERDPDDEVQCRYTHPELRRLAQIGGFIEETSSFMPVGFVKFLASVKGRVNAF